MGSGKQGSPSDLPGEKIQKIRLIRVHTGISESDGIHRQMGVSRICLMIAGRQNRFGRVSFVWFSKGEDKWVAMRTHAGRAKTEGQDRDSHWALKSKGVLQIYQAKKSRKIG